MPFIARNALTKARIDITQITNPRQELSAQSLICQVCEERMIVRQGLVLRAHFAHTRACPMPYAGHPESPQHLLGKALVSEWLRKQPGFAGAIVELEVPIHARKRIADILVTFPQGHRLAVEIQLASITTETLMARTKDYLDDDIDVLWVFGGNAAASPSNLDWCKQTLGEYLQLHFDEQPGRMREELGNAGTAPSVARPADRRPANGVYEGVVVREP